MSYSTPSEKYRKYKTLLHDDPHNAVYAKKLNKYKNMSQKGGNIIDQIMNTPKEVLNSNSNSNSNVSASSKTADLIKKINDMVEYAQESGKSLQGGAKSSVKGFRKMVGGAVETFENPPMLARLGEKLTLQTKNHEKIISGVQELVSKIADSNKRIDELTKEVAQMRVVIDEAEEKSSTTEEQIGKTSEELENLKNSYNKLVEALNVFELDPESDENIVNKAKELKEKTDAEISELEQKLENLQKEKGSADEKFSKLEQELSDALRSLENLKKVHSESVTKYNEFIGAYETNYSDLMTNFDNLMEQAK